MSVIANQIQRSRKSPDVISSLTHIPKDRLVELLTGAEPTLGELRKLAAALGISVSDFVSGSSQSSPATVLFRQTMGTLKPSHMPDIELLAGQMERSLALLPPATLPHWTKSFTRPHVTYLNAERDAETFRNLFFYGDHVSPILRLPKLVLEEMGVLVLIAQRQRIDGASAVLAGVPFIFVSPRFPPRMLFTLAHEIGHLLAHHRPGAEFAIFDVEKSIGGIRTKGDGRERFADAFASCLLLPRTGVGIALNKIREINKIHADQIGDVELLYLAHIFGVSFQVAAKRCEDLDLLPQGGAISLYAAVCRHHGSPEKRARELQLPPRPEVEFPSVPPRLLEGAIEKIRQGEMSIGRAAMSLNLSIPRIIDAHRRHDS
jgi:Zn-dependent peptidase ImmA (M78 family)